MPPTTKQTAIGTSALVATISAAAATFIATPTALATVDNLSVQAPPLGAYGTGCMYKITINATQKSTVAVDDRDAANPYSGPSTYLGASPVPYNQTVVMNWTPKFAGVRILHVSEVNSNSHKDVTVTVKKGFGTGSLCMGL
ncbi:hypothetical protein [Gordonia sp. (in: high G+C Gram-positive bacteria)]|uniref:hypothetical protein n=1 Tax=Gordonia sp. (in: high G+C Gram-positive bacteria) TaxID=84139 RepID=UPI0039E291ED